MIQKQTRRKSSKGKIIAIIAIVLVILGAAAYTVYALNNNNSTSSDKNSQNTVDGVNYGEATDEQKEAGSDQKGNEQNEAPTSNPGDPITVAFTALNPPDPNNIDPAQRTTNLTIRVRIDLVTSSGTCDLTLTKGATTITKTSGTQAGPTTSTCQGFNIEQSELSSGEWKATLKVVSGDREGSVSKTFTVQ